MGIETDHVVKENEGHGKNVGSELQFEPGRGGEIERRQSMYSGILVGGGGWRLL